MRVIKTNTPTTRSGEGVAAIPRWDSNRGEATLLVLVAPNLGGSAVHDSCELQGFFDVVSALQASNYEFQLLNRLSQLIVL